jgi:hypothetical protein
MGRPSHLNHTLTHHTIQRMSKIGGGAFGTTYRKRVRNGAANNRFAFKVISVGKLVEGLLQMDKSCRLSVFGLKAACSALVPAHTTPHARASSGQVTLVGAYDVVLDLANLNYSIHYERYVNTL